MPLDDLETGQTEKAQSLLQTLKNVRSIDEEHSYQLAVCLGKVGEHEQAYKWNNYSEMDMAIFQNSIIT
ncbi:hypothetical protein KHA80_13595 [Anaerobacillus sp. HL2]|nr:hypothetical protein KHA80_13595 [Anaerobacillus sp. HL2]